MSWWILSVLFGIAEAGYYCVNQQFNIRAEILATVACFGMTLFCILVVACQPMPADIHFYIFAILAGLASAFTDNRDFALSAKYGAGVISRLSPLSVALLCILWWTTSPDSYTDIIANFPVFCGICLCLTLCIVASIMMRKDKISRSAMTEYSYVIVVAALYSFFIKKTMSHTLSTTDSIYFMAIEAFISGIMNFIAGLRKLPRKKFIKESLAKKTLIAATILILFAVALCYVRNLAMHMAKNPAYVDAIGRGSAFLWIILFNRVKKVKDKTNMFAGIIFVISAVGIILLTS